MSNCEWIVVIIYLIASIYLMCHGHPDGEYDDKFIGSFIFILVLLRLAAYFNL